MGRSYGMPEIDDDELEAELEALGDEIALDDDTSYLDEASKAPNAPTAIPGADSVTNKVTAATAASHHQLIYVLNNLVRFVTLSCYTLGN